MGLDPAEYLLWLIALKKKNKKRNHLKILTALAENNQFWFM